ncbi:hypothetical protein AHF37_05972 [Paragonimus kellicotti]|nr:hypothetical protein AHF37_05972 [Paragonimus kellicotti]
MSVNAVRQVQLAGSLHTACGSDHLLIRHAGLISLLLHKLTSPWPHYADADRTKAHRPVRLSSLNLASNRLTHLNAFSPLGATTDGSPVVSIERIDLSHNPLNGFAVLAGLRGIAGLVELDISETPVSSRFREDDRSVAA